MSEPSYAGRNTRTTEITEGEMTHPGFASK